MLRQAGIDPLVIVSDVDEDAFIASLDPDLPPEAVVAKLANAKALSVAAQLPEDLLADCVVLGCDSMLYLDGDAARKARLRGRRAAPVAVDGGIAVASCSPDTHCCASPQASSPTPRATPAAPRCISAEPSEDDLTRYIESGEPIEVAGAFTLDGLGGWFIDRIEGDPSNVIGVSLPLVYRLVRNAGRTDNGPLVVLI